MSRPSPGLWFAVNVVVTVLATLAIGVGAYSGTVRALHPTAALKPATSPTPSIPSAASPSPQPMPTPPLVTPRLAVEDIDLVDASTGWVLLTSCNAATSAKCQYVVAATADGGDSWTKPAQVGSLFAPSDGSGPRHVRFANRLEGFVYGYSGAFVTHDGGNTWNSAGLPAQFVYDIAIGGRTAWAVTQPCPKGSFCQFEVRSSIDGGRTWSPPHSLPQNFDPVIAAVGFDSGVVLGSLPVTGMEVTSDGGKTWRSIKTQCTGSPNGESIATSDGKELWELCFAPAGRTLFVSADGGKSWSQRATPRPSPAASPVAIPAWFISNRSHVAFMQGFPQPYVTRDGGVTWNPVGSDQIQFGTMKFAGPVNGWALDTGMNLWVTTNGGDSWSQAAALPSDAGQ